MLITICLSETVQEDIIVKKNNITAINGISNQTVSLPSKGEFNLELAVKSLKIPKQTGLDTTRKGIARGFVVIS